MQITVNETGARTLADARPMRINGSNVYVVVGAGTASLMVAGRIVDEKTLTRRMSATEAQAWAVSYRESITADEEAVAEATDPEAVYAGAVETVRDAGALMDQQADKMAANVTDAPHRYRNSLGRMVKVDSSDPRHPLNASKTMKTRAAVMMAWTVTDEIGYTRYVSDGIGDTDGHFAPLDRDAWKVTLGA